MGSFIDTKLTLQLWQAFFLHPVKQRVEVMKHGVQSRVRTKYALNAYKKNKRMFNRVCVCRIFSYIVIILTIIPNIIFIVYYLRRKMMSSPIIHYYAFVPDDTSCHNISDKSLPLINVKFSSHKRIFFHDISCKGGLDSRQACAVESAAKANPLWRIEVIFAGPVHQSFLKGQVYRILSKSNVTFSRISLNNYAKDTPLEYLFREEDLPTNPLSRIKLISDTLRYITLWKYGGVYLDLDVIVVKSFDDLPKNWAARKSKNEIGAGAFGFSNNPIGRAMANATILDIQKNRNTNKFDDGDKVLYRALSTICSINNSADMRAEVCQGFEVYDKHYFYPVDSQFADDYTLINTLLLSDTYMIYAHHMWNDLTHQIKINPKSRYAKLAKMFCPKIYNLYGNEFGI